MVLSPGYSLCSAGGPGRWAAGASCAGDADAAALVCGVTEAVGVAGFEFGEAVEAFGGGVGDAGDDGGDDLVFPACDGVREGLEFGDALVLRAPVVEGKEPVADLPFAGGAAGDAGAELQGVAEFFLRDPGEGDLLALGAWRRASRLSSRIVPVTGSPGSGSGGA